MMQQKIEDVLSKHSDELMDIYFSMDSEIQALSEKEKYLLKAGVDVEEFLYKATAAYRLEIFQWKMQRYMVCRKHWMTC